MYYVLQYSVTCALHRGWLPYVRALRGTHSSRGAWDGIVARAGVQDVRSGSFGTHEMGAIALNALGD